MERNRESHIERAELVNARSVGERDVSRPSPPEEVLPDLRAEDADVWGQLLLLCLDKLLPRVGDEDDLLCTFGREEGEEVTISSSPIDREVFELVRWQGEVVGDTVEGEPLEVREEGEVGGALAV